MLEELGRTDIYLIDQMMRGRIHPGMRLLDAGCGNGRNSEIFIRQGLDIHGIDKQEEAIQELRARAVQWNPEFDPDKFVIADLKDLPFQDAHFDFVISSAVLHFAENRRHFVRMLEEMLRVLAPGGYLWIRMTTKHTIAPLAEHLYDDIYRLPDGSTRYLLDRVLLQQLIAKHRLSLADPFKTVNVDDVRTMAVVLLKR